LGQQQGNKHAAAERFWGITGYLPAHNSYANAGKMPGEMPRELFEFSTFNFARQIRPGVLGGTPAIAAGR